MTSCFLGYIICFHESHVQYWSASSVENEWTGSSYIGFFAVAEFESEINLMLSEQTEVLLKVKLRRKGVTNPKLLNGIQPDVIALKWSRICI